MLSSRAVDGHQMYYIFIADSVGLASTNLTQLALKSNAFSVKTQSNGHYAVQGHSKIKITDFGTNRKPVCNFLLVNNTNLHPISHRFKVIADYWSNFRVREGAPVFIINTLIR